MMNIFESTYTRVQELKEAIQGMAEGSAEREAVMAEYDSLMQAIDGLGKPAARIWRDYSNARDNGNERLDINDVVWDHEVEGLVSCMRDNGIKEFTFSSGWSSSVDISWLFVRSGCRLAGMVEVNGRRDPFEDKHDMMHGYLFEVA